MENYSCNISINNRTTEHLRLLKSEAAWGGFAEGPLKDVLPHTEVRVFRAQGSPGPAGTEGTVVYQVGDDANVTISIYFDVPTNPTQPNTVRAESSNPDVAAELTGLIGSGAHEDCSVKVIDGRGNG